MMLELGVSRTSEIVLVSMELSQTATVTIAEHIDVDSWPRAEAVAWLPSQNFDGLGVPVLSQKEIVTVLEGAERRASGTYSAFRIAQSTSVA